MTESGHEESSLPHVARNRRLALTIPLVMVGVAMGGGGVWLIGQYLAKQREEAPRPQVVITRVRTLVAARCERPVRVEATGFLKSPATVRVSAETNGVLRRKLKKEGDPVESGELVAELDDELYRVRLEGALARRQAWDARRRFLENEVTRISELVEKKSLGASELDRVSSELQSAQASLEESDAGIEEARILLRKCRVHTPRSGVWYRDLAREGEYLQAGQPLGVVRVLDPLELVVEVSGTVRLALEVGRTVDVEFLDVDETLGATPSSEGYRIIRLPPGSDEATRRFPVVVEVPDPGARLLPGLFARARFTLPRKESLLLVPKEAVFERFGHSAIYIVRHGNDGENFVESRFIDVRELEDQPASWQVLEGVREGERIVLSPIEQLTTGARVSVE